VDNAIKFTPRRACAHRCAPARNRPRRDVPWRIAGRGQPASKEGQRKQSRFVAYDEQVTPCGRLHNAQIRTAARGLATGIWPRTRGVYGRRRPLAHSPPSRPVDASRNSRSACRARTTAYDYNHRLAAGPQSAEKTLLRKRFSRPTLLVNGRRAETSRISCGRTDTSRQPARRRAECWRNTTRRAGPVVANGKVSHHDLENASLRLIVIWTCQMP